MIILSLDASTSAVGWALCHDADPQMSSVFVPDPALPWWCRVRSIGAWIMSERLYGQFGGISVIAYELATGRHDNLHTDRVLGAVEYECRMVAVDAGAEFVTVTASQVKATGVHKDALEMARQFKRAPLHETHSGDEADALGVAIAAWGIVKVKGWER